MVCLRQVMRGCHDEVVMKRLFRHIAFEKRADIFHELSCCFTGGDQSFGVDSSSMESKPRAPICKMFSFCDSAPYWVSSAANTSVFRYETQYFEAYAFCNGLSIRIPCRDVRLSLGKPQKKLVAKTKRNQIEPQLGFSMNSILGLRFSTLLNVVHIFQKYNSLCLFVFSCSRHRCLPKRPCDATRSKFRRKAIKPVVIRMKESRRWLSKAMGISWHRWVCIVLVQNFPFYSRSSQA